MNPELKVAFITTVNHNVGDDLVREGILYLLERRFGSIRASLIHKHFPITVRDRFNWMNNGEFLRRIDKATGGRGRVLSMVLDSVPVHRNSDKILGCDLLVQSGAPVYWCFPNGSGCHSNEWFRPLVERRFLSVRDTVPLLNIGAGSCQPYASNGSEFMANSECTAYIHRLHTLATATIVRDTLAGAILNMIGLEAPVLPCPSLFARDRLGMTAKPGEYVALTFMQLGGHYDLDQQIDKDAWRNTFVSFCSRLARRHPVLLVCHDPSEHASAARLLPHVRRVLVDSAVRCLDVYSRATCYLGSRVHGAFATASFGRPAFVVGSDSRSRMMDEISLARGFVRDMTADTLMSIVEEMHQHGQDYKETLEGIKQVSQKSYLDILDTVADSIHAGRVPAMKGEV